MTDDLIAILQEGTTDTRQGAMTDTQTMTATTEDMAMEGEPFNFVFNLYTGLNELVLK